MFKHFKTRLALSYLAVLAVVFAVFLPLMSYRVRGLIREDTAGRLQGQARLAAEDVIPLLEKPSRLRDYARSYAQLSGSRLTVIDSIGRVLADSDVNPENLSSMENHSSRPEIVQAREMGWGWTVRHSATVGRDFLYGALSFSTRDSFAFVRLAVPVQATQEIIWHFRSTILAGFCLALLAGLVLGGVLALALSSGVTRVARVAGEIAKGDFAPRVPRTGIEELDGLAAVLASMAGRLKKSFESLEGEKDLLDATLDGMTEGVLVLDAAGRVQLLNPPAESLLRLPQAQAQGRLIHEVLRNADLSRLLEDARGRPGVLSTGEMVLPGPPESFYSVHVTSLAGEDGRASGAIAVFSDVTEIKRLLNLRSEFVANVSHEIKTPLTAIRASLETLADGALDDKAVNRDFLGKALRHTERLSALIEDLLALADIEEKQKRGLAPEGESNLEECLAASFSLLEAKAASRQVRLSKNIGSGLKVKMEPVSLTRVFNNLLDNAVKYSPAGAEVKVDAVGEAGMVTVRFSDQGPGIPLEDQPRLFERFYRVDKARSRELGGTGLGLSIVKHLVEAAGGSIGLESSPGQGSSFWFKLPIIS